MVSEDIFFFFWFSSSVDGKYHSVNTLGRSGQKRGEMFVSGYKYGTMILLYTKVKQKKLVEETPHKAPPSPSKWPPFFKMAAVYIE